MQQVIIAIHLMVVTALVVLVLYQKSEGGALGMGSSGFMTGRGQANALTRATGVLATIFFLTSIALTVLPAWERRAAGGDDWTKAVDSKIEMKEVTPDAKTGEGQTAPGTAGDAKESIFEQLQRAQQRRQAAPAGEKPAAAPMPAPAAEAPAAAEKPALRSTTEEPPAAAPETKAPAADAAKDAAAPAEAPKVEEPKTEAPKAEEPKVEAPKANAAPRTEEPKVEAPKTEAPKADAPIQWQSPTR